MYEKIEYWYSHGLWTKDMVGEAVAKKVITEEQFADITGMSY